MHAENFDCTLTIDADKHHEENPAFPSSGCEDMPALGWYDGKNYNISTFSTMETVKNNEIIDLGMDHHVKIVTVEKETNKKEKKPKQSNTSKKKKGSSSKNKDNNKANTSPKKETSKQKSNKGQVASNEQADLSLDQLKEQPNLAIEKRDDRFYAMYDKANNEKEEQEITEDEAISLGYEDDADEQEENTDVKDELENGKEGTSSTLFIVMLLVIAMLIGIIIFLLLKRRN